MFRLRNSLLLLTGAIAAATVSLTGLPAANAQTLYDGTAGGTPPSQGSFVLGNVGVTPATETYNAVQKFTTLDSTASIGTYAGYSNYNVAPSAPPVFFHPTTLVNPTFPALDRTTGFTLHFTAQVLDENHSGNADRAGFSVVLLGSDHQGIEIGFQNGGVFSQSTAFTQAETDFSPTLAGLVSSLTSYDLTILGGSYSLTSGGSTLLTGAVRDYSGVTPGLGTSVYSTPNFLFLGDDTSSAGATTNLAAVSITLPSASAPEPGSAALLALGLALPMACRLRLRRRGAMKNR